MLATGERTRVAWHDDVFPVRTTLRQSNHDLAADEDGGACEDIVVVGDDSDDEGGAKPEEWEEVVIGANNAEGAATLQSMYAADTPVRSAHAHARWMHLPYA